MVMVETTLAGDPSAGAAISMAGMVQGPPSLSNKDDQFANEVMRRWTAGREHMADARRDYSINLAFYLGFHWIWWSDQRGAVMPWSDGQPTRGKKKKARIAVNRFGLNVGNVWNRMLRSELRFEVPPTDAADAMIEGAKRSEKLLTAQHDDQEWERTRADEILAALLGGTSLVACEWDENAGEQLKWNNGADDVEFGTGDVKFTAHNVNEFVIEPNVRKARDATWWISGLDVPCATAAEWYGLKWMPRPDVGSVSGTLGATLLAQTGRDRGDNLCLVLCYYERPTRKNPKGKYACVINNTTVYESAWPFPFKDRLNIEVFRQRQVDGQALGRTYLTDAIPVQVAYNEACSVLTEHMKLVSSTRLMAPMGSLFEEDLHGQTGDLLYWTPDGTGAQPGYLQTPDLGRWIMAEPERLRIDLDALMNVSDVSKGIGYDRAAAQALTFLAEQDDSGFGHMVFEQRRGWESLASMVLQLYGARVKETRTARIAAAPGVTDAVEWNGTMLQGQYRVSIPIDAVTPRNAAARLANAKDLWDRKIITDPRRYARMVGLPEDEFGQLLDPDAARANVENLRMLMGIPELPEDFDDHAVHIAEHNDRCRKTDSYKYAPPEVRAIVDQHIQWHENKAANEFARQKALEDAQPMASTVAQASAPDGSLVPMSEQEDQSRMAAAAAIGANPSGMGMGGGTPATPALPAAGLPTGGGTGTSI